MSANLTEAEATFTCTECGDAIDCCEFCDERECPEALCGECVRHDVRDAAPPRPN